MKDQLLQSLLNKVNGILTGSDAVAAPSKDNYIAWCSPGVPFQADDLQFLAKGVNGNTADETRSLLRTAYEFSTFANSIPSSNVMGGTFEVNGSRVWDVYDNVLRMSNVVEKDLTKEEEAKVKKLRGLLTVEKKRINLVTDEEEIFIEDSPMIKAYNEKMGLYSTAVLNYNNRRLSAINADDKASVQDFALNADTYRLKVKQALNDWVSNGYKNDVEQISAYIQQISLKSLTLIKQDLLDKMDKAKLTDPTTGSSFFFSSLFPSNFVNNDNGWTDFSFTSSNKNTYSKQTHTATSASVGISWGLWSASGDGSHEKNTLDKSFEENDFEISFKLVQVPIGRSWFSPDFLFNKAWDWDQGPVSDGSANPKGSMIAYPTVAVFIKDLTITSANMKDVYNMLETKAGGSVGYGPFKLSASHSRSSKEEKTNYDKDTGKLTVEGMQLLAFKCFALPKTPDCIIPLK